MELQNESGFPASLSRAALLYRDLMLATVVLKLSFEVRSDGQAVALAAEDQLPIWEADAETPLGTVDADEVPVKPGCDVAILGHARSLHPDQPVECVSVDLRIGSRFSRQLTVHGDRIWLETGNEVPVVSRAAPFTAMPLTYDRAYGGVALVHDLMEAPYAPNPAGRGYVRLREHVAGVPLPNVEEPDQLIASWEQTPLPAGTAPLPRQSSLRVSEDGYAIDVENQMVQLGPAAFSFAHPRMRMPAYPGGEPLYLAGATHHGPWRFVLPQVRFALEIALGTAHRSLPLVADTLCLMPDYGRFFVLARRAFVYQVLPERLRTVRITSGEAGPGAPTTSIAEQRRSGSPVIQIAPAADNEALPLPFDSLLALYPLTSIVEALPLCPSA